MTLYKGWVIKMSEDKCCEICKYYERGSKIPLEIGTEVMLKHRGQFAFKKTKIIEVNTYPTTTQYKLAIDGGESIWDSEMIERCGCNNCKHKTLSVTLSPCIECSTHDLYVGWEANKEEE